MICQNCADGNRREAVIEWLPHREESWCDGPSLWCFGCFVEEFVKLNGTLTLVPSDDRHAEIVIDYKYAKPTPKAPA